MLNHPFTEGELMAFLHGEENPQLKAALLDSAELRKELAELAQTFQILLGTLDGLHRPDPQDLIDVAFDVASPAQRLRVAAYTRHSERGRREMQEIEQDIAAEQETTTPTWKLPIFFAAPLAGATGVRSDDEAGDNETDDNLFQVIDIQVQITVRIVPPVDGRWALEGFLTQNYVPLSNTAVALHAGPSTLETTTSDEAGFFRFENIEEGLYEVGIYLNGNIVQVESIRLQAAAR